MKAYVTHTTRGQARRLRRLAWNALQQYALDVAHLRLRSLLEANRVKS